MSDRFETLLCSTGQHRELLDSALRPFGLVADIDLAVMQRRQHLADLAGRLLAGLDSVLERERPDMVLVQGDTTTAFVGALAAYYRKIPVAHIEAGLRTRIYRAHFPRRDRRLISSIASIHFAPTPRAEAQLLNEGVRSGDVFVTGNTVIDALQMMTRIDLQSGREILSDGGRTILVTMHRREKYGTPFENICQAIKVVADLHARVRFLIPTHPAPKVREPVTRL